MRTDSRNVDGDDHDDDGDVDCEYDHDYEYYCDYECEYDYDYLYDYIFVTITMLRIIIMHMTRIIAIIIVVIGDCMICLLYTSDAADE